MAKNLIAFQLVDGAHSSGEPATFAGVPGVWQEGVPITWEDLADGLVVETLDEVRTAMKGLPVEEKHLGAAAYRSALRRSVVEPPAPVEDVTAGVGVEVDE